MLVKSKPDDWIIAPINCYYSLAVFEHGVPFTSILIENKKQRNEICKKFNEECYDDIIEFDFLVDIDLRDHEDVELGKEALENISEFLDEHDFPYQVVFSGKGFHIKTPYKYFGLECDSRISDNVYEVYQEIAVYLNENFSDFVDCSIYDPRRLCKIPFTVAFYKNFAVFCAPLNTKQEIENFKIENYKYGNYLPENYDIIIFNETGNVKNLIDHIRGEKNA
jgi:hypothetical protein